MSLEKVTERCMANMTAHEMIGTFHLFACYSTTPGVGDDDTVDSILHCSFTTG